MRAALYARKSTEQNGVADVGGVLVIEDPIPAGRAEAAGYLVAPAGGVR